LSSKPLKSFNWTKLPPNKLKETIWKDLDDAPLISELKEEFSQFEDLFAAKEVKNAAMENAKLGSAEAITSKEISFLDPKRAQNCNIMLKAIKLVPSALKQAINNVDDVTLTTDILTELLKFVPTDEEVKEGEKRN